MMENGVVLTGTTGRPEAAFSHTLKDESAKESKKRGPWLIISFTGLQR